MDKLIFYDNDDIATQTEPLPARITVNKEILPNDNLRAMAEQLQLVINSLRDSLMEFLKAVSKAWDAFLTINPIFIQLLGIQADDQLLRKLKRKKRYVRRYERIGLKNKTRK